MSRPRSAASSPAATHRAGAAAVVGATGFIGAHLCRALNTAGHAVVPYAPGDQWPPNAATMFFVAGRVTPANAGRHPELVAAELATFREVLDAVPRSGQPVRAVLASSGGTVYSPSCQPPYHERHPVAASNAYGAMKLEMESMLFAHNGIEPVAVRFANVYGPGQRARRGLGVIAHWIHALKAGHPITLLGNPDATRDFLYIDDAADVLVRVHTAVKSPSVINAGSGAPTTLAGLANLTLDTAGCTDRPICYAPARRVDRMHVWLDIDLARRSLAWVPGTSLSAGLRQTWAHHDDAQISLPNPQRMSDRIAHTSTTIAAVEALRC